MWWWHRPIPLFILTASTSTQNLAYSRWISTYSDETGWMTESPFKFHLHIIVQLYVHHLLNSQIEEKVCKNQLISLEHIWFYKWFYFSSVFRMGGRWRWLTGRVMKRWSCLVGSDGLPIQLTAADLGVDPRLVFLSATIAPGDKCPGAFHCRPQGHQSHPGRKEEPVRAHSLSRGRKAQRCSSFPPGTTFPCADPPRGPSFPWEISSCSPHCTPILLLPPSLSPFSSTAGLWGQEEMRDGKFDVAHPARLLSVPCSYISSQKGTRIYCLHMICLSFPWTLTINTAKRKLVIFPQPISEPSWSVPETAFQCSGF